MKVAIFFSALVAAQTATSEATPTTSPYLLHPKGRCGNINGTTYSCPTAECCSDWGYCGTTAKHCAKYHRKGLCGIIDGEKFVCRDHLCCSRFGYCGSGPKFCRRKKHHHLSATYTTEEAEPTFAPGNNSTFTEDPNVTETEEPEATETVDDDESDEPEETESF